MLAYIFIKPIGYLADFEMALRSDSPEELTKFSAPLEQAFQDLRDWPLNVGMGKCLSSFGAELCMEIPMDKVPDLTQFLKKFEYTAKMVFAVGVGISTSEAYMAMLQSEQENGQRVVLFSSDVEAGGADLEKAEGNTMHSDIASNLGLDDDAPDDEAAKLQPQGDPKAKKQEQSAKQKIIETLLMVKEHAPIIAQLKELNPKAFEAVKKVIDAMITMAQKDLAKAEDKLPGGEADNLPKGDFDPEQLRVGTDHEMEHTQDRQIASEIARDHLIEDPNYYKKIKEIEKTEPIGEIKDGQIKVQARDEGTHKVTGSHWHRVVGGMALGPTGHAVSSHEPQKE